VYHLNGRSFRKTPAPVLLNCCTVWVEGRSGRRMSRVVEQGDLRPITERLNFRGILLEG